MVVGEIDLNSGIGCNERMRKTDKKIENQLRLVLTDVCEAALKKIDGFEWLTHLVEYSDFPNSLKVICIFDTNENLAVYLSKRASSYEAKSAEDDLKLLIQIKLLGMGVSIKNIDRHVTFDTEEDCAKEHNGKWQNRLS